ncbi:hypothetical protein [Cellulomonas soli]
MLTAPASTDDLIEAGLVTEASIDRTANAQFGVVASQETVIDSYGAYTRLELADDAPVLTYDPEGEWGWMTEQFDAAFITESLKTGATYLVEDWADSPVRWDDSKRAWDEFTAAATELIGPLEGDPRTLLSDSRGQYLDVDDWRQALGLRPEPYVDGQVRVEVTRLEVDHMYYYELKAGGSAMGLSLGLVMAFDEVVVRTDGTRFVMPQEIAVDIDFAGPGGGVEKVSVGGDLSVGRTLEGGVDAVPLLEVEPTVPGGWQTVQVGRLSLALPPGAAQSTSSGENVWPVWRSYTLGAATGSDAELPVMVVRDAVAGSEEPGWFALDGFENARLQIPGATSAVAEFGSEADGRYLVRIDVYTVQDGAPVFYEVEFDSTAETAQEELLQYVATMSVAAA